MGPSRLSNNIRHIRQKSKKITLRHYNNKPKELLKVILHLAGNRKRLISKFGNGGGRFFFPFFWKQRWFGKWQQCFEKNSNFNYLWKNVVQ